MLLSYPWSQSNFTTTTTTALPTYSPKYGTVTLVHLGLVPAVRNCFRLKFAHSTMGRDAVFVELSGYKHGEVVRIGNTHLESLAGYEGRERSR